MSEFKWVPEVGDKFSYWAFKGMRLPDHIAALNKDYCFFRFDRNQVGSFEGGWPHGVEPRGKRAAKKYDAQKAKWESEQVEINVGDWVVCESGNYDVAKVGSIYKVSSIEDNMMYLYETGLSYHRLNFRKATPEEIKAHKLSLKPSVEQLRIERDAAADALAGYCCGVYPKGENIHLEKFKEAKAAHELAVGGEG